MNNNEIWLPVKGYEGLYEVSNLGNVRSFDRLIGNVHGTKSLKRGRMLKKACDSKGYHIVKLCKDAVQTNYKVHRIVAEAFIPNPKNLPQVNHKDECKINNCVDNLEWCTNDYNIHYGTGILRSRQNNKVRERLGKEVCMIDIKTGAVVKTFPSSCEAVRQTGILHIHNAACGSRRSAGGYIWKYKV